MGKNGYVSKVNIYKGLKNLNSIGWEMHIDKIFLNGATLGMGDYNSHWVL